MSTPNAVLPVAPDNVRLRQISDYLYQLAGGGPNSSTSTPGLSSALAQNVQGIFGGTPLQVISATTLVAVEVTRSTDGGTTYSTNAVVGPAVGADAVMANCARVAGGTGTITRAHIMKNSTTVTNAQFRLHIYNTAPTPINDKAANILLYADVAGRDGTIDFLNFVTSGAGSDSALGYGQFQQGMASFLPFKCAAGSTSLILRLEALAGYVAAATEKFYIKLLIIQD